MLHDGSTLMHQIIDKLEQKINFEKDLPTYIFNSFDYDFWFFERPILGYKDLIRGLIQNNNLEYRKEFIVFFGNPKASYFKYFLIENDFEVSLSELVEGSINFFNGTIGYPFILTNINFDWIGFESAYEELGVFAVKKSTPKESIFVRFLDENFISYANIDSLLFSDLDKLALILKENYCSHPV